jgi:hypothetical protein
MFVIATFLMKYTLMRVLKKEIDSSKIFKQDTPSVHKNEGVHTITR